MAILANVCPDDGFPVVMKPKDAPQAKCRVEIPGLPAGTECTGELDLASVRIDYRLPHSRLLEVLEDPPKEHVFPLLFCVYASRPIGYVKAIALEAASEKFVALLAAESPAPGSQMGVHRPDPLLRPPFGNDRTDCDGGLAGRGIDQHKGGILDL